MAVLFMLLSACVVMQAKELVSLTDQHFKSTATIKDDPLNSYIEFSTQEGFVFRNAFGRTEEDVFLRGSTDRRSKHRTYEVYQYMSYREHFARSYYTVSYEVPGGSQSRPVRVIAHDRDCYRSRELNGCLHKEHFAFEIDEALARTIASFYGQARGTMTFWQFKFQSHHGDELLSGITPAEMKGLLDRMDDYVAAMK
jgi:hypothetical protein